MRYAILCLAAVHQIDMLSKAEWELGDECGVMRNVRINSNHPVRNSSDESQVIQQDTRGHNCHAWYEISITAC